MTDYNLLKAAIYRCGMTFKTLASSIGVSMQTMSMKAGGKRDFTASEISKIQNVLGLDAKERDLIFFGDCVAETATKGD